MGLISCPRCKGKLVVGQYTLGKYIYCLMCGKEWYHDYVNVQPPVRRKRGCSKREEK